MTETVLDFEVVFELPPEVADLCRDIMMRVVEFYKDGGPPSRDRVMLVMNALAVISGVIIASTDDPELYPWFGKAVAFNVNAILAQMPGPSEGATVQ